HARDSAMRTTAGGGGWAARTTCFMPPPRSRKLAHARQVAGRGQPIMGETRVHPLMRDRAAGLPVAVAPACAEALRMQGVVLHLRGDYSGAVGLLQQAHRLKPDDALIRMNLAT